MTIPAWVRKPRVQRVARIAGAATLGLVVFLLSLVWTFPVGRLRPLIEARASRDGVSVRIGDLAVRGVSTLSLSDVRVEFPPEVMRGPDAEEVRVSREVTLDRLDIGVGLLRLMFGGLSLQLQARNGDGVLGPVTVVRRDDRLEVEVERIRDFAIPETFPIYGIRFRGTLQGKGALSYDLKGGWAASTGRFEISAQDVVALRPTLRSQTQGEATLSDVNLGSITLKLVLDKPENIASLKKARKTGPKEGSVIQFEQVEVDGEDIKALVEGQSLIRLIQGRGLADGTLQLDLAFALSDSFFDREVKQKGAAEKPNRFLKFLLEGDPRWRAALSGGYYGVACSGAVRSPSCVPKKPSIRGGEFRRPEKPVERPEKPTAPAQPAKPVETTAPAEPARATPASPPPPVVVPAPTPPAVERPAEPSAAEGPAARLGHPPAVMPGTPGVAAPGVREGIEAIRTITPTIIGRPKIRQALEAPTETEGPAAPASETEEGAAPAPTTAPAPGDEEP